MRDNTTDHQGEEIAVIGYAARLPGAQDVVEVWNTLEDGRCNISRIPDSRWSSVRFFDPNRDVRGKTYAQSAGLLDNVYDFDAVYFGISPREAEQMDPQQRILLETVARAFDDAGVDPARLDRERTGVFIGASSSDHSTMGFKDPKMIDAQYMLGNTLSIISNRISYQWDLSGPSYTIDTACSSGLYALEQAVRALRTGDVDTAIVGSVNILLSPLPFIGFAQASMLSQVGLCQAFGKEADGYVRGEGAVVFVLRRADLARVNHDRIRSMVLATGTNSDGRTTGIAMPSSRRQFDLFEKIRNDFEIEPDDLAFVEAHGTGTPVGDPEEARAIGAAYGKWRSSPLPIGSAKTNFGHLEPASGLVGLLKTQLSLEKGVFPASLHADDLNPNIPFEELGLEVAREPAVLVERDKPWLGAVNSFGFGGANAHAVLKQAKEGKRDVPADFPQALVLTAASEKSLEDLLSKWAKKAESTAEDLPQSIADANRRLAKHQHRIALAAGSAHDLSASIRGWLADGKSAAAARGTAHASDVKLGLVFSGNGSQWAGMGRHMMLSDPAFRESFAASKEIAADLEGISLLDKLMSIDLEEQLERAPIAQPLLLAIQIAAVDALSAQGVKPDAVLGHSAGEVAAAFACGAITREDAFRIILSRSRTLDKLFGNGTMAGLACSVSQAQEIIEASGLDVNVAAENSPESITVSGPTGAIAQLLKLCRKQRIAGRKLAIDYAYHSHQLDKLKTELISELEGIGGKRTDIEFFSGSTGGLLQGDKLDNHFWWRNARDPVQFRHGVEAMAQSGTSVFLEISPRSVLKNYVRDTLDGASLNGYALGSLEQVGAESIDASSITLSLLAHGVSVNRPDIMGRSVSFQGNLPTYPFDRKPHALSSARERDLWGSHTHHSLLGSQVDPDATVWTSELSLGRLPWLADHRIANRVLFPATAIVEMFLAAAKDALETDKIELRHVEILRPIELRNTQTVSIRTTYDKQARRLTLEALQGGEWNWIAGAAVFDLESEAPAAPDVKDGSANAELYSDLTRAGLEYGPAFSRLDRIALDDTSVDVLLCEATIDTSGFLLDPTATDACLHGLFPLILSHGEADGERLLVPGHVGKIRFFGGGGPSRAHLSLVQGSQTGVCVNVSFVGDDDVLIAEMRSLWLRPLPSTSKQLPHFWQEKTISVEASNAIHWQPSSGLERAGDAEPSDLEVVRDAIGSRLAWNVATFSKTDGKFDSRLDDAQDFLQAMGVAASDEGGKSDDADCPWPDLSVLLKLLIEIDPESVDEIEGALQGSVTDQPNDSPGFSKLREAMLDYLSGVPANAGRVLMVGHIDPQVLSAVAEKADHVVVTAEKTDEVDTLRLRLGQGLPVHFAPFEDVGKLPAFDIVIAGATGQTLRPSMQRQLARYVARGNPAIFFDYTPDIFARMSSRYSDAGAVRALDKQFLAADLPLDRKVWRQDASLSFAYLDVPRAATLSQSPIEVIGNSPFAKRLREAAQGRTGREDTFIVALEEADDTVSTIMAQREALSALPERAEVVWIAQEGTTASAGLQGMRRVLRNEVSRDIRSVCIDFGVPSDRVLDTIASSDEHELVLSKDRTTSVRIVAGAHRRQPISTDERLILSLPPTGRTEALTWKAVPRVVPTANQIEIEVAATALNFRDVMFARGLLPPDILNGGYAGPTLGMECAGVVSRVGPGAEFRPGDRVVAFSPSAFATHVTIDSRAAILAPTNLKLEAAAAIPVVYVTAEYALTELARLRPGEWCLIHGGAGGVGLAAIQVAQRAGAKIIATAGSEKKRALLRILGVEHVCDSRSLEFVNYVEEVTGGLGVDVILNSLAGKAMEQSLACLAPFGRFVELGKRDFVANTAVGLRAMRNNISYFGVDADQLLQHRSELGDKLMKNVAQGFDSGDYFTPPIRTFSSAQVIDAFRLMENSGHIGKVVVTPPKAEPRRSEARADYTGSWLIAGGTKGFGLETARKLADHGANRFWLVSRSGALQESEFLNEMSRRGIDVECRSTDLTDQDAVTALFDEVAGSEETLSGIVCGAAVFDDAYFAEMDTERFERVVRAKLGSARLIDEASRGLDVRHFWLYSSVSGRFGNPGQSAYVAANMELEALARDRSKSGFPALAVAWGPVGDAGYLTETEDVKHVIERKLGGMMTASLALDQLFGALSGGFDAPVITIAPMDWARLKPELPLLSDPLFECLDLELSEVGQDGAIDLGALIAEKGETKARRILLDLICGEAAQVLRIAPGEIDVNRELTDLGFDSLMGMNLKLAIEERIGASTPLSSIADGMTLARLTHLVVSSAQSGAQTDQTEVMAERHLSGTSLPSDLKEEISHAAARQIP